jgi:NAD(P)H-flavin reductase
VFWTDWLAEFSDELIVCTDDGSAGRPGFVTSALKELPIARPQDRPDKVIAIGPMPMMHA